MVVVTEIIWEGVGGGGGCFGHWFHWLCETRGHIHWWWMTPRRGGGLLGLKKGTNSMALDP